MENTSVPNLAGRVTLTINETAEALGCSRRHVYRLIERQGLPVVRFGSRQWVPVAGLLEWVESASGSAA